ncbi:S26 family signal peptidase [Longispora albida]|uniref:S26 family signal peptidase n=1 Tax=Longispora albida TaxID=203523 RepID=UPI00036B176B|nr:S26 family signal peptidase [Longispora albida]
MTPLLVIAGVLVTAGVVCGVLRSQFAVVTVSGANMEPALRNDDRVLVRRRRLNRVRRGEIVVIDRQPGADKALRWLVNRAAALPGDPVPAGLEPALLLAAGDRVPPGRLVILGDNQELSFDSRHCGYVPADQLLGVVVRKL